MKKYLLIYNGVKAEARYNDSDMLVGLEIHEVPDKNTHKEFLLDMPLSCKPEWLNRLKGLKAEPMSEDLSFIRFWNTYSYKVGKKARAERLWETLSPVDRQRALDFIGQYNAHLTVSNHARLYPETYLAQERWNN
jgi:hypothetical protein